jgi:septal ring factor EnvC (AmiA/AmiB activator)
LKSRIGFFLVPLFCALLVCPSGESLAAGKKADETRQSLKEIEQRLSQASKSLSKKEKEEKSLGKDLKTVESELARLQQNMANQDKRLVSLKEELAAAEGESVRRKEAAESLRGQVEQRLVTLYKDGDMGLLRALMLARSPARMAEDYEFFGRIVRRDRELLDGYRRRLEELSATRERLAGLQAEQEALVAQGRRDRDSLKKAAELKKRLLAKVKTDKGKLAGEVAALKERAARLSSLVKKLESTKPPAYTSKPSAQDPKTPLANPFGRQKGRLSWPVNGKVKVPFGTGRHADLGTLYESHGIEISASPQQPVTAVWSGRVAFANEFKGYGNLLILDHGDSYYTLYAQASRLAKRVGETVAQGETVAYAGYDGSDTVYFEIRHRGTPLNPAPWLKPR